MIESHTREAKPRFKMIPEFEKWPRLVQWSQQWYGKLIVAAIFLGILTSFTFRWRWERLIIVAVAVFLPLRANLRFLILLIYILLSNRGFHAVLDNLTEIDLSVALARTNQSFWQSFPLYFDVLQLAAIIFVVVFLLKFFKLKSIRTPFTFLLVLWLFLIFFCSNLSVSGSLGFWSWTFCRNFSQCLLAIYFCSQSRIYENTLSWVGKISVAAQNLLLMHFHPILRPTDVRAMDQYALEPKSRADEAICRIKAIKLLLASRAILLVSDLVRLFCFGITVHRLPIAISSLNLQNYAFVGFERYNRSAHSAGYSWIMVFLNCLIYIFSVSIFVGQTISMVRLLGVALPRPVYRITDAKNFNDYFKRLLYYYCRALVACFFLNAWDSLSGLKDHAKMRTALALFLTVAGGGYLYHCFLSYDYVIFFGPRLAMNYALNQIPYFIFLALLCVMSWYRSTQRLELGIRQRTPQWMNFLSIFFIHSCLLTFSSQSPAETWALRWVFLKSLVGRS